MHVLGRANTRCLICLEQDLSIVVARNEDHSAAFGEGFEDSLVAFKCHSIQLRVSYLSDDIVAVGLVATYEHQVVVFIEILDFLDEFPALMDIGTE